MSPDRHADRLHAQLAGGAELTPDQQRHVATCAACQRAVAEVGRLDEQIRAAAAGLASEPIPDADLEPVYVPRSRWAAPLSVVLAAGLIGIVIGYGLGQVRPPTGADATPTPPIAEASGTPSPSASAVAVPSASSPEQPSPSPSPLPVQTPRPIPLATGGEPCADGEAGFSIVVPDGWHANLRQESLMACAFLLPEPFDPLAESTDPAFDAPVRLTTSVESTPEGTIVEEDAGGSTWIVDRAGEDWRVHVEELYGTIDDETAYLHVASRADDPAANDAFESILDGLSVTDPIFIDPDAAADAEALFADADVCSDLLRGVNVTMPDEWWTNTVFGDLLPCSYFAQDTFEIGEPGAIPDGVAITLEVIPGDAPELEEVVGFETLVVDNRAATRTEAWPPDTDVYRYVVEINDVSLVLTLRSEQSDDYERDKAVLDEMMRRLIVSATPPSARAESQLPSCGWELIERTADGERGDPDVRICLLEAYRTGEPAEMVRTGPTVEGGVVRHIYRVLGPDDIEWLTDWTHDPLSSGGWERRRCTELEIDEGRVTGEVVFTPTSCDEPEPLEPEPLEP
jgi:hypothetical protein